MFSQFFDKGVKITQNRSLSRSPLKNIKNTSLTPKSSLKDFLNRKEGSPFNGRSKSPSIKTFTKDNEKPINKSLNNTPKGTTRISQNKIEKNRGAFEFNEKNQINQKKQMINDFPPTIKSSKKLISKIDPFYEKISHFSIHEKPKKKNNSEIVFSDNLSKNPNLKKKSYEFNKNEAHSSSHLKKIEGKKKINDANSFKSNTHFADKKDSYTTSKDELTFENFYKTEKKEDLQKTNSSMNNLTNIYTPGEAKKTESCDQTKKQLNKNEETFKSDSNPQNQPKKLFFKNEIQEKNEKIETLSCHLKRNTLFVKKASSINFLDAVKLNDFEKCKEIIKEKTKINISALKDENGWNSLHWASWNGNLRITSLVLGVIEDIDAETGTKLTALSLSCQRGCLEIVNLLVNNGANINFCDIHKNSCLHYAAMNGHNKIVEFLLHKSEIDLYARNSLLKTAKDSVANIDILKIFEENESKLQKLQPNQEHFPIHIQSFQENPSTSTSIGSVEEDIFSEINQKQKISLENFQIHGLLGRGSFGEVYLVQKKDNGNLYAMKVLQKSRLLRNNLIKYALTEKNVLSLTNHPFIVRLYYSFQTSDQLFMIMEFCPGGDLGQHLQKEKKFTEERTKIYMAEVLLALEDLHKRDIIFRDLKPDNIVLDKEGHALLTDFGLSKEGVYDQVQGAKSFCGSVAYLAPEMLRKCGHGKAVDWYLLGVVMYEMLVGIPPFYANNKEDLFANIEKAPLKIPNYISADAASLLKCLLQRNPEKRLGSGKSDAEEIKLHPFFKSINWTQVEKRQLKPPVPENKIKLSPVTGKEFSTINLNILNSEEQDKRVGGWSFAFSE